MTSSLVSTLGRAIRGVWWLLDFSRRAVLNLLLLLFVVLLLWGIFRSGPPPLQAKTALVLSLQGGITEQRAVTSRAGVLRQLQGEDNEQFQLRDVLAVLDAASRDAQISHAVLVLDDFSGAGLSTLHEVGAAIQRFKAAGKPVVAWGSHFDQRQYYLAAHATEVWLHPMGSVLLEGYGSQRSYYKDLLDKVGVTAHVIRAGKFKNFNESYTANGPSPETVQADSLLYNTLWTNWTTTVERARKLPLGSIAQAIESLPDSLLEDGGDAAQWALKRKWVDALKTRDEMRAAMVERGAADTDSKTFRQVSMNSYLGRIKPEGTGDTVGVIVAEGSITEGHSGPGSIGGLSTSELVRQARDDPKIKAVVLRVNSPGGSAFASELIRRELELTRKAGKPVVVSMGDVAASGGYWIATASDEMLADAGTITGSIGVIAMLPTAKQGLDKLGVSTAGVSTTWLGGGFDPRRDFDPRLEKLVQTGIDQTYRQFIGHVVTARKSTPEKIAEVAQGRVWTGADALSRGLVDRLGSLGDALQVAASRAKLAVGYRVQYIEAPPGRLQLWLQRLGVQFDVAGFVGRSGLQAMAETLGLPGATIALGLMPPVAAQMADDMAWLADQAAARKPFSALVHCLCSAP
jgi:protease-4